MLKVHLKGSVQGNQLQVLGCLRLERISNRASDMATICQAPMNVSRFGFACARGKPVIACIDSVQDVKHN